jgi:hypothetical protein
MTWLFAHKTRLRHKLPIFLDRALLKSLRLQLLTRKVRLGTRIERALRRPALMAL